MSIVQKYKDLLGADYYKELELMGWFIQFFGGKPMTETEIWEAVERIEEMAPKIAAASMITAQEAVDGMARFAKAI